MMASYKLSAMLLASTGGVAQFDNIMQNFLFIIVGLLTVGIIIWLTWLNQMLLNKLRVAEAARQGIELPEARASLASGLNRQAENLMLRLRKRFLWNNIPIAAEHTIDLQHDYDGIRELDNNLPPWWINMFYICILWAGVYMWYYHFGGNGPSQTEEYNSAMLEGKTAQAIYLAQKGDAINEGNVTALAAAGDLAEGAQIFGVVCKSCHGEYGQGINGPNLTDEYWIHGGGIKNVFKTIKHGVVEKGMTAWGEQMSASDMQKVASYVLSLAGTKPAGAKEPEGQIWKEEAQAAPSTVDPNAPAQTDTLTTPAQPAAPPAPGK
jgi:cytochrome c oxidase cbb3-type subunit 3